MSSFQHDYPNSRKKLPNNNKFSVVDGGIPDDYSNVSSERNRFGGGWRSQRHHCPIKLELAVLSY